MAKKEVVWADENGKTTFNLSSTWKIVEDDYENFEIESGSFAYGHKTITFDFQLPVGAEIKGAKIYSTWEIPTTSARYRRVVFADNSYVDIGASDTTSVADVPATLLTSPIDISFRFLSNGYVIESTGYKSSTVQVSNVILLVEYNSGVYFYRVENDKLVPYQLYCAENDTLVPYELFHAENNELVRY